MEPGVAALQRVSAGLFVGSGAASLFNQYNPDPSTVDLNFRSATFGTVGGGVRDITTRVIQLGAKLYF